MGVTFTGNRRSLDPMIIHAEEVIYGTYGDTVRVSEKRKDLLKFGGILATDGTTEQTIANFQGATLRETYATSNSIDSFIVDDTFTGTATIEGHTISGSDLTFAVQNVTGTSTTAVTLSTPLARVTRAFVYGSSGLPASSIAYVYDSTVATGTTGGVPDVAAATKLTIQAAEQQSEKAATSVSSQDYWIVTGFYAAIQKASGASTEAIIRLRHRVLGNVFRTQAPKIFLSSEGTLFESINFDPFLIIPKNSDVELTIEAGASGTQVSAGINGYLAKVIS